MILDGKTLEEIGLSVRGPDWKTWLARKLGVTRQTIHAKSKSKTGLPKTFKRQLLAVCEDQLLIVAAPVNELRQDVGPP